MRLRTTQDIPSPSLATDQPVATFRALFFAALMAGIAAGAVASVIQAGKMWPLIAAAEMLESTALPHHDHGAAEPVWSPEGPLRPALTVLFNVVAGLGFGLILNALARFGCEFRGIAASSSDRKRPLIPTEDGHRFRSIPAAADAVRRVHSAI
jgi:hypothetical protein